MKAGEREREREREREGGREGGKCSSQKLVQPDRPCMKGASLIHSRRDGERERERERGAQQYCTARKDVLREKARNPVCLSRRRRRRFGR